jgi:ABC-type bacteriocin/lantibiotic exporter with double-glycine peptidase domain
MRKPANLPRFWRFLRPHWRLALGGGLLMLVMVGLQLPMPLLTMYLLDVTVPSRNFGELHWIAIGLLAFLILKAFSTYYQSLVFAAFRNRVIFSIRRRLFSHLQHLTADFYDDARVGQIAARVMGDVNQVQGLLANVLLVAVREGLTLLVGLGLLLWMNWKLALVAMAVVPFYGFWLSRRSPSVRQLARKTQEDYTVVTGDVLETFSGIHLVKSYVAETAELLKMLRSLRKAMRSEYRSTVNSTVLEVGSAVLSSLGKLSLIWYGGYQIMTGTLTLGQFIAFNSFLRYLFDPTSTLVSINTGAQQALAAVDRLYELLDQPVETRPGTRTKRLEGVRGAIEFKRVGFSYDGVTPVLSDIDLRIEPGAKVAIVGRSGSGKSTLMKLLLGFHAPSSGSILIDDQDIQEVSLNSLRRNIAFVPQDAFLFTGDVWFNLSYGRRGATRAQMEQAARLADASDFIGRLPRKYETEVGERGVRLSGGQRQRLLIAMAFLKDAPILLLDEATSSVDVEAERAIRDALSRLMARPTTLVIAHRMSTIREADYIVLLDKGHVVQVGKHEELFARSGGLYEKIYRDGLLERGPDSGRSSSASVA